MQAPGCVNPLGKAMQIHQTLDPPFGQALYVDTYARGDESRVQRLQFWYLFPHRDFTSAIKNIALTAQVIPEPSPCLLVWTFTIATKTYQP